MVRAGHKLYNDGGGRFGGIFAMLREPYVTESVTQVIQALADLRSANPLLLRFAYDDA